MAISLNTVRTIVAFLYSFYTSSMMDKDTIRDIIPTPRDLIFSCVICQNTLSQADKRGSIRSSPPTDPYNSADQTFWLTECAHVTCSKHLDNEGEEKSITYKYYVSNYGITILASLTSRNTLIAPCPLCSSQRDDRKTKTLYAISGFQNGQYDKDIPKAWFDVPPLKLDSSELGIEALRVLLQITIQYGS